MDAENEKMIKVFFDNHKTDVVDTNFTEQVMNKIPKRKRSADWIIVFFTFIGMIVTLLFINVQQTFISFYQVFTDIPYYYYLGFIAVFPLIFLSIFCIKKGRLT